MNNIPDVKVGVVAVSRDCFPMTLSMNRRKALVAAYQKKYGEIFECPTCVENELHMRKALSEVREAGCNALVVYLDPADQNWIPELAARFGFAPVVSREAFMGGMRAVIHSKNILIDNSFATLLREAKEEFVFAGGMTDE